MLTLSRLRPGLWRLVAINAHGLIGCLDRGSGRIELPRRVMRPLEQYPHTEAGSASLLLAATVVALVWANLDGSSYASVSFATAIGPAIPPSG